MNFIKTTPQAIISLLIAGSLLVNTAAPVLAQVKPHAPLLTPSQQDYLSRQTYIAVNDAIVTNPTPQAHLQQAIEQFSRGNLTNKQLGRLLQIRGIFLPAPLSKESPSDFEQFNALYQAQIDKEFAREKQAMQDSMGEVSQQIYKTGNTYRKEIYESLVKHVTARVLIANGNDDPSDAHHLSKRILNDLQLFSFNPNQDLSTQLAALSKKYKKDPQATQIFTEIANEVQQDDKYLAREEAVLAWKKQADAQLQSWYKKNFGMLSKWKQQATAKAQQVFDNEYKTLLLQARETEVKNAVRDLWAYKNLGPKAKQTLLDVAPIILPLRTLDGKSFFSSEQKNWLQAEYMTILQHNTTCGKENPREDSCNYAFLAITGLSMLTSQKDAAHAIEAFMQAQYKTPYAVPSLLTGTAALLSMKQYGVLGGFIYAATRNEYNIDNLDILSFETLVNLAANINGQYLGEVSKYAQYPLQANPTDQTALANAWEDVAQLLAGDGSPQALALLRKYGVEQCRVFTETSITLKEEQKVICSGIMPFLAGALASGKSGASQYNPNGTYTAAGYYLNHLGHSVYISPEQAQRNARQQAANTRAFYQYAASMGLSNEAMLARHLFLQSMGDLNAESELRLDTQLYKVYEISAKRQDPKPGFAIRSYTRNSGPYNAKRVRQDRTQFWRKAARIGDIAVLIWCIYDISKWAHSGVKIARAITKASSMARNGATVAERAMMLRRLHVAPQLRTITGLDTKIKKGMAPSVLAELPHFTSQTVELPKFEGFVESAGKLVAQNMRFSTETGVLAADMPALTQAAQGAYSAEQLNSFNNLLNTAAANANVEFANRSALRRFFTWNKDASYRSYLSRNLTQLTPTAGLKQADLHTLALQTAHLPVRVPQNIATFKAPSFLENVGGATQLNMAALTQTMTRAFGRAPAANQLAHTERLLNTALVNANAQFLNRNWLARQWSFLRGSNNQKYKNILLDNIAAEFDKDGKMFTDAAQFKLYQQLTDLVKLDQTLTAPAWTTQFRHFGTLSHGGKFHTMGTTLLTQPGAAPVELPLAVQMQLKRPFRGGIKGVNNSYQRVLISQDKKGNWLFGFGNDLSAPIKPSQFKLTLEETDVPALIRAAQGTHGPALELKLTSPTFDSYFSKRWTALRQSGSWNPIPTLFRGKNRIYAYDVPVSVRLADGSLQSVPLVFKSDSFLGLRNATAVLEEGGKLAWYRDGHLLNAPKMTFGLPKNQISPFLGLLRKANLQQPLRLTAVSGKNKIEPLMWATGLSLSSASTGLIAPLENVYGDRITEMDKTWISLAFPYVPSLAAPLFSPLVMKIGALRTLQLALGVSTVGLGFAALNGFKGKIDKQNPPPVWPLFVSGMAIGVSSALSRSGLNLLIDSMGGGGTLLKSMAYKNIGSFALLLPPFVANFIDKDIDFSLAFPVLGTLSAGALTWVSASRISTGIGKVEGFMPFEPLKLTRPQAWIPTLSKNTWTALSATGKEAWSTMRLLGTKEVLPLVLAATAFTGFEAGAFSKAGNQMIRPIVKNGEMPDWIPETNRNNYTAMLTNLSVISFPLITRLTAKPVLKWMETGRAGDEYRRMLQASFALNATGAGLLYANGFDGFGSLGFLGIGLMGLGTANMTQSFQKLSNISVKSSSYARKLTYGLTGAARESMEKSLVTKTMTGFPVQQLGIAIVPTLVSGYTDRQIAEGTIQKSEASHSSLWIPIASLALCFGLSMPHIGLFPARVPTGAFGLTKGLVGSYPGALHQLQQPQFYLKKPYFGVPNGFTPLPHNPILNTGDIMPSQKALEKIERQVKQGLAQPQTSTSFIPQELPADDEELTKTQATHTL